MSSLDVGKAIILSAGQGRRLSPLTDTRPKCLVELSGSSVLHWQLRHLREAGLKEAVVVTGFGAEAVDAEIAGLDLAGMKVRTLFNPFYGLTDNLATCWLAREEMAQPFLLLNGDTLFEPAIAKRLLAAPSAPITVTIDRKPSYDADDMKVLTEDGALRAIGKTIDVFDAESIGFLRFTGDGPAAFRGAVDQAMQTPEGLRRWYLGVIDQLARDGVPVATASIEGLDWAEMDTHEDVAANKVLTERWSRLEVAV
jgi:choline kinase